MTLLLMIGFLLAVVGIFDLLALSPFTFLEELGELCKPKNTSLKSKMKEHRNQKPPKGLKLLLLEVEEILRLTGKSTMFTSICVLAMFLFVFGCMVAISLNNLYLVPVLAVGFSLMPFFYVKFIASRRKKQIQVEIETALSVVTASYMRGENSFLRAVEENVEYLNPPMYEVFSNFLLRMDLFDSNIKKGLEQMKLGVDHEIFHEWIIAVMDCQEDHKLKSTLQPIVNKLSDVRIVSTELEIILQEPVKECVSMIILLVASIPIMYFLNTTWYHTLMYTDFGKILQAICGSMIFLSIAAMIKHTRPIEYKR